MVIQTMPRVAIMFLVILVASVSALGQTKETRQYSYAFIPKGSTMFGYTLKRRSFGSTASGRFTSTGVPGIPGGTT